MTTTNMTREQAAALELAYHQRILRESANWDIDRVDALRFASPGVVREAVRRHLTGLVRESSPLPVTDPDRLSYLDAVDLAASLELIRPPTDAAGSLRESGVPVVGDTDEPAELEPDVDAQRALRESNVPMTAAIPPADWSKTADATLLREAGVGTKEANAASSVPSVQRGDADAGGEPNDPDEPDEPDATCPDCTEGRNDDGSLCGTCGGTGVQPEARQTLSDAEQSPESTASARSRLPGQTESATSLSKDGNPGRALTEAATPRWYHGNDWPADVAERDGQPVSDAELFKAAGVRLK